MLKPLLLLVLALPCLANAELEKVSSICDGKSCFYTLPKLPSLNGWHLDRGRNNDIDATVLVPDGYTLETAETVIYARALSKPLISDNPSLAHFISMEKDEFPEVYPGVEVSEVKPIVSATGTKMRSLVLVPKAKGKWEQITYTEENGYFVVITLSAKTAQSFQSATKAYVDLLTKYK